MYRNSAVSKCFGIAFCLIFILSMWLFTPLMFLLEFKRRNPSSQIIQTQNLKMGIEHCRLDAFWVCTVTASHPKNTAIVDSGPRRVPDEICLLGGGRCEISYQLPMSVAGFGQPLVYISIFWNQKLQNFLKYGK